MNIQESMAHAFAINPGYKTKVRSDAEKLAASMNELAEEGELYEVHEYQGGRFVVSYSFNGEIELFL